MSRRIMRFVAITLCFSLLLLGVTPPAPASATNGRDIASDPYTGWTTGCNNAGGSPCDENDSTFTGPNHFNGSPTVSRLATQFTRTAYPTACSSGVCSFTIHSFRLVMGLCTSGWPYPGGACGTGGTASTISRLTIMCTPSYQNGDYDAQWVVYDDTSPPGFHGGHDTGQVNLDEPCEITALNGDSITRIWIRATLSVSSGETLYYTTQFFDEALELEADFEDYVYDLRLDHPPFERVITWAWKKTWTAGSWNVIDSDLTELAGSVGPAGGAEAHSRETVRIQCMPVCGVDTYTITVCEIGFVCVGYEISSSSSGQLIADAGAAFISFIDGCYNVSADSCVDNTLDAAADALSIRFTLVPQGGSEHPDQDYTGTVSIGRWDRASGFDCQFVGSPVTTGPLALGAHAPQVITAWDQGAGFFGANGQFVLLLWTSTISGLSSCATVEIPMTGSTSGTVNPPVPGDDGSAQTCTDLPSCVGNAVRNALDGLFGVASDVWSGTISTAHDAMLEKLPFAYIVLALDGIDTQLDRAGLEVENSDDCPGITLEIPLYYGSSPSTPTPTNVPITVLTCAQLEPAMGTTWYQAVRTMLDPALWLLFGWSQLKQLQPKTSLGG